MKHTEWQWHTQKRRKELLGSWRKVLLILYAIAVRNFFISISVSFSGRPLCFSRFILLFRAHSLATLLLPLSPSFLFVPLFYLPSMEIFHLLEHCSCHLDNRFVVKLQKVLSVCGLCMLSFQPLNNIHAEHHSSFQFQFKCHTPR